MPQYIRDMKYDIMCATNNTHRLIDERAKRFNYRIAGDILRLAGGK